MNFQAGQKIGSYTLNERIGDGAFSQVFSVSSDEAVLFPLCIKISKTDTSSREAAETEIEMLKMFAGEHECIMCMFDNFIYTSELGVEHICIVLRRYSCDLHDYRKRVHKGKIPYTIAMAVHAQIVAACNIIHAKGYIHTDIKPENILIVDETASPEDIRIILADYGTIMPIAEDYSSSMATPEYQAPEIILGCNYGKWIDYWAQGCTLYEMVTGEYLFDPTNHNDDRRGTDTTQKSARSAHSTHTQESWQSYSTGSYDESCSGSSASLGTTNMYNLIHLYLMDEIIGTMDTSLIDEGHYSGIYFDYANRLFGQLYKESSSIRDLCERKMADLTSLQRNKIIGALTGMLQCVPSKRAW